MPRSATFTVTPASSHSTMHNSRAEKPRYLIDQLKIDGNPVANLYDLRHSDSDFLELAAAKYKETTGQKMQQKQKDALIKETVLSLEAHHTEGDVQKVFDELAAKYGGHYITELAIHRDEGHFEDENGITYYPTKDILMKADGWYIVPLADSLHHAPDYKPKAEEFSEKVDISRFKPIHNVHAHVKFSMFDLNAGKTGRMLHKDLNDRIRTAARILQLTYDPDKATNKRTTVTEIKARHKAERNERVRNFLEYGPAIDAKNREIERLIADRATTNEAATDLARDAGLQIAEGRTFSAKSLIPHIKAAFEEMRRRMKGQGVGAERFRELTRERDALIDKVKAKEIAVSDAEMALKRSIADFEARLSSNPEKSILDALRSENSQLKETIREREVEIGLIDGLIDGGAPAEVLKQARATASPRVAYGEGYKTARERAGDAYRERLGRQQPKPDDDLSFMRQKPRDLRDAVDQLHKDGHGLRLK